MRILVAYATADGSTRGIAERIATRLRERGQAAVALPVHEVRDVAPYDAFVVGSPLHDRAWLPEARRFLEWHGPVLAEHPTWLFSVGIPASLTKALRVWVDEEGPRAVSHFDVVRARDSRLFAGVVSKQQLPRFNRLVFRSLGGHYGDFRDWEAIDEWSDEIAAALQPVADSSGS